MNAESGAAEPSQDDRNMALVSHAGSLLGLLTLGALNFVVPLAIWLMKKDDSSFVGEHARESLNFQITVLLLGLLLLPLSLITCGVPNLLLDVVVIVLVIIGGLTAREGRSYRYPFALRLLR